MQDRRKAWRKGHKKEDRKEEAKTRSTYKASEESKAGKQSKQIQQAEDSLNGWKLNMRVLVSLRPFSRFVPSFIRFFPSLIPAFPSFSRFPFLVLLSFRCVLYLCSLAYFTFARLLPKLLLACCLYFCSPAAFTSARLLLLLLLACFGTFFCGFVKWLVVDCESLYLHFNIFLNTTWRHVCQFWFFFTL